jgi:predicted aldo/keto reductase-like oxidoreductase
MTPIRCLAYTLSQAGVCTTIPGVRSPEELDEVLSHEHATAAEKDYSEIVKSFKEYHTGQCVYCNHCLPCPSNIDIGQVTRLLDISKSGVTADAKAEYDALEVKPSECTQCNTCRSRCPFDVDVISNMKGAANLFQ